MIATHFSLIVVCSTVCWQKYYEFCIIIMKSISGRRGGTIWIYFCIWLDQVYITIYTCCELLFVSWKGDTDSSCNSSNRHSTLSCEVYRCLVLINLFSPVRMCIESIIFYLKIKKILKTVSHVNVPLHIGRLGVLISASK